LYAVQPPAAPGGLWTEEVLYSFGGPGTNTSTPATNIVPGPSGSYYVLTQGGINGPEALFQLQPPASGTGSWTATMLYTFAGGRAASSLVAGPNGALYGTSYGGPGIVFQFTPPTAPGGSWTASLIHKFGNYYGFVDNPIALTVAPDGTIYGTAYGRNPPL